MKYLGILLVIQVINIVRASSGIQGLYATQSTFRTQEIGRWRSSHGRISKRCVTQAVQDDTDERSFIIRADADREVVTEHCEYVLDQATGGRGWE